MIEYDAKNRVVTCDLVDLEHMGFDHELYESELYLSGLPEDDAAVKWPIALLVNFRGGAVITPDTSAESLHAKAQDQLDFKSLLACLSAKDLREAAKAAVTLIREQLDRMDDDDAENVLENLVVALGGSVKDGGE
jgi:hypothetical protein